MSFATRTAPDVDAGWCIGWKRPPHFTSNVRTSRDGLPLCTACRHSADTPELPTPQARP